MTRSEFIKQLSLSLPVGMTLPLWLSACKSPSAYCNNPWKGKVTIIGAGAAGLYAALLLYQQGVEVEILEATSQIGGRIRSLQSFAGFAVELGAEEIHGSSSSWYKLVKQSGYALTLEAGSDYYYYKGALKKIDDIATQPDIQASTAFIKNLSQYQGADVPLEDLIKQQGDISQTDTYYNALIGNEYGASDTRLGARSTAIEDGKFSSGEDKYYFKDTNILSVLQTITAEVLSKVKLNVPVASIDYHDATVIITDAKGNQYGADKVLLTVPLGYLKTNKLTFAPVLPTSKIHAISTIGMGAGIKVILKFSKAFWAADTVSIYGTGYVPEFWVTDHGSSSSDFVLTAFIMGERAEYLSSQGSKAVSIITQELDTYFGSNIASSSLINSYIMDWSKEPYTVGAYSYPSIGSADQRSTLAAAIDNKLFFAGEATSTNGHIGTVHGAIETAERAVKEILCN
jgi:monoamine oxidase